MPPRSQPPPADSLPFWRIAGGVAVGVLIANAITWGAAELRARYELRALAQEVEAQAEVASRDAAARAAQRRLQQAEQSAQYQRDTEQRILDEQGPLMRRASTSIPTGEVACLAGNQVRREPNGWTQILDGNGTRLKCRDRGY